MPPRLADVLIAAYTPRLWPPRVEEALGTVAGVVVTLDWVRAEFGHARMRGRTRAPHAAEWLEELLERGETAIVTEAREEALGLYGKAMRAYRAVRGDGPCLVEHGP